MKRWWAKLLLGLATIALLLAIPLTVGIVSARRELARVQQQIRGSGGKLDLQNLRPAAVLSQSNSASVMMQAAALLRSPGADVLSRNPPMAMRMIAPGRAISVSQQPVLLAHGQSNTWEEIATAIAAYRPGLELLEQLPPRARFDFKIQYQRGFTLAVPHLSSVRSSVQSLSAAALVHLQHEDTKAAARSICALLNIINAMDDERLLISELVRYAMTAYALPLTWELIHAKRVNDAELAAVAEAWDQLRFQEPMENALRMEQYLVSSSLAGLRRERDPAAAMIGMGLASSSAGSADWFRTARSEAGMFMWRTTWSYDDERRILELTQLLIETLERIKTNGAYEAALAYHDAEVRARGLDRQPKNWLRISLDESMQGIFGESSIGKTLDKMLLADALKTLATTETALKRFHLRHGRFPETLAQLVPELLPAVPNDPADGRPLRYHIAPDGTYLVYSIGDDMIDNGGSSVGSSKEFIWWRAEDWVLPKRGTQVEADAFLLSVAAP